MPQWYPALGFDEALFLNHYTISHSHFVYHQLLKPPNGKNRIYLDILFVVTITTETERRKRGIKKPKMFCCYKHKYRLVLVTTRQSCSSSYTWLSGTITTCSFCTVWVVYHHVVCACPSWVRETLYIQYVLSVLQELGHLAARISFLILFYIFFLALSELRGKRDTYLKQCMHHYPQPTPRTTETRWNRKVYKPEWQWLLFLVLPVKGSLEFCQLILTTCLI